MCIAAKIFLCFVGVVFVWGLFLAIPTLIEYTFDALDQWVDVLETLKERKHKK